MAWGLIGLYALVVVAMRVPVVQRHVAASIASAVATKLATHVEVGSVSVGMLNRIIIDGVRIDDQRHREMLSAQRLSAKINLISLLRGRVEITSAQVFGLRAALVKPSATAPLNCQFVLDSLASKDTTTHTPLDLCVSSLVIRNSHISYDRRDCAPRRGLLDPNHLSLDKVSGHVMLYTLTDDSLSVRLKTLSMSERNSGLTLSDLSFTAEAGRHSLLLDNLNLRTEHSDISIDASARLNDRKQATEFRVTSNHSSVGTDDLACLLPGLRGIGKTVFLDGKLTGDYNHVALSGLAVNTSSRALSLSASGKATSGGYIVEAISKRKPLTWSLTDCRLHAATGETTELLHTIGTDIAALSHVGDIDYTLSAKGTERTATAHGTLTTAIGTLNHDITLRDRHIAATLTTGTLHLGPVLGTDALGDTQLSLKASADLAPSDGKASLLDRLTIATADITAPLLTLRGYPYRNVKVDAGLREGLLEAKAELHDVNASLIAEATARLSQGASATLSDITLNADIQALNPAALNITNRYPSTVFSANVAASLKSVNNPLGGLSLSLRDFLMVGADDRYYCGNICLISSERGGNEREMNLTSDFAELNATGRYDIATLGQSLTNLIAKRLPTLPGTPQYVRQDNDLTLTARVTDTAFLRRLLGVNISADYPIDLNAAINDRLGTADITLHAPHLDLGGTILDSTEVHLFCPGDTLHIAVRAARRDEGGGHLLLSLAGNAADNGLSTSLTWDNGHGNEFRGSLNTTSHFFRGADGKAVAHVGIKPSAVMLGDTLWHLHPSDITYTASRLHVDNFLLAHGRQHISINGNATRNAGDSLVVSLQDVNVAYIMNLVNFHSVEFEGHASGTAVAKTLFATPEAYADLAVRDFRFEQGRMGTLSVRADWDNAQGQINIDGRCDDPNTKDTKDARIKGLKDENVDGTTLIAGYVSIKRNYIDLDIEARQTRLEFMQSFCSSFLDDVTAWASGRVRLAGDLSAINLTGKLVADGELLVTPLNTRYSLRGDTILFVPDDIRFNRCPVYDANGNRGIVSGGLHHHNLARMTYDLSVTAEHLLCFDFPTLDGSTFCGHVVGTGTCEITGRPGELTFDIEAYPEETSSLTYNAASPDAIQSQEFITWRDSTANARQVVSKLGDDKEDDDFRTNIRMNFLIHATPKSTLRLLMDEQTGDYITLNGNGTLRATYYNKGAMQIFGNYQVTGGEYKMTFQQIISKSFAFQPGGTITFGGDPFQAAINLQAMYVVPSVPLSDLNIGNSFRGNTVRVNCLMNISGTAERPSVDFDLSIPQASADVQQMITSVMDSEQERSQQVLYLLGVGRFYVANNNMQDSRQSQTSLAMQSFLSGTLSQQLGNIISDVVLKNRNWNFGANISPGDEGMMNAEYEGIVSGSMLNNRLLINGQFGYRDNANATTSFIGDFDIRYLLFPSGNLQVRFYNQSSDRYFTKSNLNTQGIGIIFKHDFNSFVPNFLRRRTMKPTDKKK